MDVRTEIDFLLIVAFSIGRNEGCVLIDGLSRAESIGP